MSANLVLILRPFRVNENRSHLMGVEHDSPRFPFLIRISIVHLVDTEGNRSRWRVLLQQDEVMFCG